MGDFAQMRKQVRGIRFTKAFCLALEGLVRRSLAYANSRDQSKMKEKAYVFIWFEGAAREPHRAAGAITTVVPTHSLSGTSTVRTPRPSFVATYD